MVSSLSIFFMFISLALSLVFPPLIVLILYKRKNISLKSMVVGVLVFFVLQVIIRSSILSFLSFNEWYQKMAQNTFLIGLFLGLSAALFEEFGRFAAFKIFLRKELEWKNGIAYGLGHGGIESAWLVGMTYLSNIITAFMINSGSYDKVIAPTLTKETAAKVKELFTGTPAATFLAAGLERVMTMSIHVALSLIVLYAVMSKRRIYLLYAIIIHTILNMPIPALNKLNIWAAEAYILIFAVASLVFIIKSKEFFAPAEPTENVQTSNSD